MKKILWITIFMVFVLGFHAQAFETSLLDIRNEIFMESSNIKRLVQGPKEPIIRDIVVLNGMWDSCIMTMSQLDAYFSMVGIFNTIKKENTEEAALDYLMNWLKEIKKTNDANIKGLGNLTSVNEQITKTYMQKLRGLFSKLNERIDSELVQVNTLKISLGLTKNR